MHTLSDIARRAGTSVATVSLALRGRGQVSRKTADRIRALAQEMGYRPNPLLSSLAGKRFRSPSAVNGTPVAILNFPAMPNGEVKKSSYHQPLIDVGKTLGYEPKVWDVEANTDGAKLYKSLYFRMVQGIVITGSVDALAFGKTFDWRAFSVVQCARFSSPQPFHIVRPNIFQAVKLVFTKLRAMGYKRIGFAPGRHPQPMEDDEARYGAAVSMESSYLAPSDRIPVYDGKIEDGRDLIAWLRRYKPDALIGFSVGQYWILRDAGIRFPEDMGFASLHLNNESDMLCSGLIQNPSEIARQSIMLLDQMIRMRECGYAERPLHLLIPSDWHDGETLVMQTP